MMRVVRVVDILFPIIADILTNDSTTPMEADIKNISIISKGILLKGYAADEVVDSLSKRFKISPAVAKNMLREGAVLKKSATIETAKKLIVVFKSHGLQVRPVVVKKNPVKKPSGAGAGAGARLPAAVRALSNKMKEGFAAVTGARGTKEAPRPISLEGRKWRAHFGGNNSAPGVNPIHGIMSSLAAIAGSLPALLFLIVLSVLLFQFVSVVLTTASYLVGNTILYIFSILFNAIYLVIVAFLIVKILVPRSETGGKCFLHKKDAPDVYALLEALCALTGSPFPSEIVVTNRMEIQLQPLVTIIGLRDRELSLSIGLPMLALKNKRQFIAELVHELGHYSGSNKVPAYYLISVVHRWLENRELVPTALDATTRHPVPENYRPSAAVWVLEKAAEGPRAFVTFLLSLSSRINRRVVDWVQYSADYYTAYILGSEHFNEFLKDQKIAHATYRTVNDINAQAWKHHKLLRDIPAAVVSQYQQWSEDELRNILDQPLQLAEDNWLIPTMSDSRMARINKRGFEGVYKDTSSAVNLFIDFTSLCEKVTLEHYKQQYGNDLLAQYIVDNNKIIAMSESLSDAEMALDEFLSGTYTSRLLELATPTDKALIMLDHQQTIDWIRKHLFEYRNDQKLVKELWHTRQEVRVLIGLIDVGVDVSAIESSIERRSKSELATLLPKAEIEIKALQGNIATVDQMITKRFMMAVVKMSPEDKELSGRYFGMVRKVGGFSVKLRALAEACVLLRHLIAQHNPGGKLLMKIDAVSSECRRLIGGLLSAAVSIAVFSDDDQRSLREYIDSSTKLDTDDLASLSFARMLDIADDIEKVIIYHYTHTLGQLAKLCHRQEARLNIRPLKLVTK